jgi:hypothetical protein
MSLWTRITKSNFAIRLKSWEYWPFGILQFPIFFYYLWLSIKARSFLFFTASNPGITMGGMFGESKYDILKKIPPVYIPRTILIQVPTTAEAVIAKLKSDGFNYPLIFKPDLGERGFMVKKIIDDTQVVQYLAAIRIDFIVQEFVDLPFEYGVFYTRFPQEPNGKVTSIVTKEMLTVKGDGNSTLRALIFNKDRAKLQWAKLKVSHSTRLNQVIPAGELVELVGIGNHALGATFRDGKILIDSQLSESFDTISKQIDGFYFGKIRFALQVG